MNKENRELALKKMSECKQTKQKYAAGGVAKVRKNVATKSGKAIKEK